MNQKINSQFVLVLGISFALIACNQQDKKAEPAATDTTAKTEPVQPAAQDAKVDAVKAAPDLYKVLSDTLGIRILEATYKPGDSSAMHYHPDYAIYAAQGGTATFYGKDGAKMEAEMKTGLILVKPAEFHSVKNTGKTTIKVILFEVNRPAGAMPHGDMDAVKIAGNLYKVAADTLGIRVLLINYKPGQSSAMHSHPDNALYVTDAGKAEFTDKDGKKTVAELKKGMTMIGPAESHSVKNIGTTTMKAILVEVSRPVQ
jgi:quercetin dioxygenase-like cupin family protein